MAQSRLGVHVTGPDSGAILAGIKKAEETGIQAAWLTTGGAGSDGLTILAGAAVSTQRILLGTSIIPTFPRHPLVMAQQVQVIHHLAPGRFRLGIGPSGRSGMEETFGVDYRAPLGHVSEYLHILKSFLQEGEVDFDGRYYQAHAKISTSPMDVPVMASALGVKAYELCGAGADGAISWVCPGRYLRDVGLPAMKRSAENSGRPVPPLVAHVPVCVHEDPDEARESVRQQFGFFPRTPFYQRMFIAAGFPEASQGTWSDEMVDAVALWGDEARVEEKLEELFSFGAAEILASPVSAGGDREASFDRTMQLLAKVARTVGP
ncbi:MAG: LLM class flavin-dependent oxidoreductase [Dehalococcoidia bacterium]|nr:LLM class flavin-dependent oxidoreductase [Dehalococcoidia bacterium]